MTLTDIYQIFNESAGVCTDTRTLKQDQIFFALSGENFNGNKFVPDALKKGAKFVVCDDPSFKRETNVLVVPSVLDTLQSLANHHRRLKKVTVLAITGSNGKTTTKELITRVLETRYSVLYTHGNLNNHIGVPLTLLRLQNEEVAVIEMGANHPGEIALLCDIAEPDLGLITNIGKAHLEGFGSIEGVRNAKGELYAYLSGKGHPVLIHSDDMILNEMASSMGLKGVSYGTSSGSTVAGNILNLKPFLKGEVTVKGRVYTLETQMIGGYNFTNILAALAAGEYFQVNTATAITALEKYTPSNNRSQVIHGKNNILVLDAYNANPSSMNASLDDFLDDEHPNKMVIIGEMMELGDHAEEEHHRILEKLHSSQLKEVILIGDQFWQLSQQQQIPFLFFRDIESCMAHIRSTKPSGFRILLKGSRKNRLEEATNLLLDC